MFWHSKSLKYNILIPPISKPLAEFSVSEAASYFSWFKDQIPYRIEYMSRRCSEHLGIRQVKIDMSPDSLKLVWRWFLEVAELEYTPMRKMEHLAGIYSKYPYAIQEYLMRTEKEQFSLQTEYILLDIGMYMGEVFVKNNPIIHWGYYTEPKTDFSVNRPVLLGFVDDRFTPPFSTEFDPIHMVGVQAANIWDNSQNESDLLRLYYNWQRFIPTLKGPGGA